MSTKKNILQEAIADSRALKSAAIANAQALILESMKDNLKEMVEDQMNEMADDETVAEACDDDADEESGDELSEGTEMEINEEEDFDLDDLGGEEDELEGEDEGDDLAGLDEADLHEALMNALQEVDHGKMGDLRDVGPDEHHDPVTGADKKEAGWEEKTAPAKQDWTMKESAYRARIAKLATENAMLKKANGQLRATVNEVNLFNTKLHFAHKLLNKEGLSPTAKKAIISKMDGVKTVTEAKTLYESLELALGALSERKTQKKSTSLSEALGLPQASQGRNVSNVRSTVLQESNPFDPARMQILAGVKK